MTKVRRVPAEALLASPFAALPDIIRAHAAEHPDQLALVEGGEALTYGRLAALMDRIAFALQRDGAPRRGGRDLRPDLDQLRSSFLRRPRRRGRCRAARAVLDANESHDDAEGQRRQGVHA